MYIVTANEMYDIDRYTIHEFGMDSKVLMENAGRAISDKVERVIEKNAKVVILVGSGSNGGDGFVLARTLLNKGYHVNIVQVVPNEKISGDAFYHKSLFVQCDGQLQVTSQPAEIEAILKQADVIVDAILGIGVKGELRQPIADIVDVVNAAGTFTIAIDIPSGLPADEGVTGFQAVQADYTIIVAYPKMSALLQHTAPYYGKWETVSIGIPVKAMQPYTQRYTWNQSRFQQSLPERKPDAHKGNHGRGFIIGGSETMPGSVTMTAKASLKAGAGLITVGTAPEVIPIVGAVCQETTFERLTSANGFPEEQGELSFDNYDAVVLGMGMGRQVKTGKLIRQAVQETNCPLIIDADGLYHAKNMFDLIQQRSNPTIITPHPGEMAMLLDISVPELLQQPFAYAKSFAAEYNVHVVLKGMVTIITSPDNEQAVSTVGNQGLAKGGSGDVLAGIILAMVMQKQSVMEALANACFLHGKAADLLVEKKHSTYDLTATDVIEGIADVYRTFI